MSLEGFPRPSKKELSRIDAATEQADPTAFSPLVSNEQMSPLESPAKFGEGWYEVIDHPDRQQFYARLMKGIVPVADIVSTRDAGGKVHYFSKHMPHELIQEKANQDEAKAHMLFLASFTGDIDHYASPVGSVKSDHNYRRGYDTSTYFDFGMANAFEDLRITGVLDALRKNIGEKESVHLHSLVDAMRARISGDDGRAYLVSLFEGITDVHAFMGDGEIVEAYEQSPDKPGFIQERLLHNLDRIAEAIQEAEASRTKGLNERRPLPRPGK